MNDYKQYFLTSKKLTSEKKIALVKGTEFENFIKAVISDTSISLQIRAYTVLSVCGGLRCSETISLDKREFSAEGDNLFATVGVLKKRRADSRNIRVHPAAVGFITQYLANTIGNKLFKFSARTAQRYIKDTFKVEGIQTHSFRHSSISYFLFEKEISVAKTASLHHISFQTAQHYSHLCEKSELLKLWK